MRDLIEKYKNMEDENAYYIYNGKRRYQSVHGKSYTRVNKGEEQLKLKQKTSPQEVKCLITDFLEKAKVMKKNVKVEYKKGEDYEILDTTENRNRFVNINYQNIKDKNQLKDTRDIVWIKFTKSGYAGVVAVSSDINFDIPESIREYDKKNEDGKWLRNSSGIIIHKLEQEWDESFVLIFPLHDMGKYQRHDIEKAVGNYLIEQKVPLLDYYSHLYG